MDKQQRLRQLARAALIRTRGDVPQAMARLDADIIKANDIELERALTATWREYALRGLLNSNLTDLRSEGVLRQPKQERQSNDSTSRRETWAHTRVQEMEQRAKTQQRNYLNDFKVGGEPIGDLTPETVLGKADLHERDARFMRLMASGVPPQSRIRDFITPDEAEQRWKMAHEPQPQPQPETNARQAALMKMLTRSRGLNDEEYRIAQARVRDLQTLPSATPWDAFELDVLARVMSEYESKHD